MPTTSNPTAPEGQPSPVVRDLNAEVARQIEEARASSAGRSSQVFHGATGGVLSQVLLALRAGAHLSDHKNPGEAFLVVLHGRVRLSAGEDAWEVPQGGHVRIPDAVHAVEALEDSAFLLTIAKSRAA